MRKLLLFVLALVFSMAVQAGGIGGGGGGVHGIANPLPLTQGGTGAQSASAARTALGAAASGVNGDITGFTGLTGSVLVPNGYGIVSASGAFFGNDGAGGGMYTMPAATTSTALIVQGVSAAQTGDILHLDKYSLGPRLLTVKADGTISSGKACASGYTRITLNYCKKNSFAIVGGLVAGSTTPIAAPASDAKALDLMIGCANTAGTASGCTLYADAGLTIGQGSAQTTGTNFQELVFITQLSAAGGNAYLVVGATASTFGEYGISGYYD